MEQHVFLSDIPQHVECAVEDTSTGRIVIHMENCELCVQNDKLLVVVRVKEQDNNIQNEHRILSLLNTITGKTIRSIE